MKIILLAISIFFSFKTFAQSEKEKNSLQAYLISPNIDSLSVSDLFKHDTLKLTDSKLKILSFNAGVEPYTSQLKIVDVAIYTINGNTISGNKYFSDDIRNFKDRIMVLSISDINYVDETGDIIKSSATFSFIVYK